MVNSNEDYSTWTVEHCGKPRYLSKSPELIIDDVIKLLGFRVADRCDRPKSL